MAGRRTLSWFGAAVAAFHLIASSSGCRDKRLPEDDGRNRSLVAGRTIFERKCASCHGLRGDGKTVTAGRFPYANLLDGKWRGDGSLASIEEQIRRGRDPMPKFQGKLTDEEIRETAEYVLDLSRSGRPAK